MNPPRRSWLVGAIALGAFVGMLDATIVAVALGPITRRFALPLATGQEVIAIYLVVVMATLPTIGRLSDRFGRRRAYIGGFTLFALGSLIAATASSFTALLVGRMVQAVGGGVLMAGSLALIAEHVPRRRTGRSVAVMVTTQAVAGLVGPPLGGLLVALGGWQAVFWAGLPLGVLGVVLTVTAVPASAAHRDSTVDIPGAVLVSAIFLGVGAGISSLAAPAFGHIPAIAWFSVAWIALLLLLPAELDRSQASRGRAAVSPIEVHQRNDRHSPEHRNAHVLLRDPSLLARGGARCDAGRRRLGIPADWHRGWRHVARGWPDGRCAAHPGGDGRGHVPGSPGIRHRGICDARRLLAAPPHRALPGRLWQWALLVTEHLGGDATCTSRRAGERRSTPFIRTQRRRDHRARHHRRDLHGRGGSAGGRRHSEHLQRGCGDLHRRRCHSVGDVSRQPDGTRTGTRRRSGS